MLDDTTLKRARERRADFDRIERHTRRGLATYDGGEAMWHEVKPYTSAEDDEKLAWRRNRTLDWYTNYVEFCTSQYVEGIHGNNAITRETGIDEIDDWLKSDYDIWRMNDAAPYELNVPECFVTFDRPSTVAPLTRADDKLLQNWPRPRLVFGDEVLNYEQDASGALVWLSRTAVDDEGETYVECFDATTRYELRDNTTLEEPHGFTAIPWIRVSYRTAHSATRTQTDMVSAGGDKTGKTKPGVAFLAGVQAKCCADLQIRSMLVEAGYQHLHLQMYMDAQTLEMTKKQGALGNTGVIILGTPASPPPGYLLKPSMELDKMMQIIFVEHPAEIMKLARLRDRGIAAASSGVSKVLDSQPEIQAMRSIANFFQQTDRAIVAFIATQYRAGYNTDDIAIQYPSRYDFTSPADELNEIATYAALEATAPDAPTSRTYIATRKLAAIRKEMPDAEEATLKAIEDELNEPPPAPEPVISPFGANNEQGKAEAKGNEGDKGFGRKEGNEVLAGKPTGLPPTPKPNNRLQSRGVA